MAAFSVFKFFNFQSPLAIIRTPVTYFNSREVHKKVTAKLDLPAKPKKPPNPFLKYATKVKPEIIKHNPEITTTEIIRKVAKMWSEVSESEKSKLKQDFKTEMNEYKDKMEKYYSFLTKEQLELLQTDTGKHRLKKTASKLMGKPKKPTTPFLKFYLELVLLNKSKNILDVALIAKEKWEKMSDSEKRKYHDQFKTEKDKYENELLQWEDDMIEKGFNNLVRNETLRQRKKDSLKS